MSRSNGGNTSLSRDVIHVMETNGHTKLLQHAIFFGIRGRNILVRTKSDEEKCSTICTIAITRLNPNITKIQCIIVTPSKEIANEIFNALKPIMKQMNLSSPVLCIGGVRAADNAIDIHSSSQLVVGTPGRISYLLDANFLPTDLITMFILVDTNWLFSSNMNEKVAQIWCALPKTKQIITVSPAYSSSLKSQLLSVIPDAIYIEDDVTLSTACASSKLLHQQTDNETENGTSMLSTPHNTHVRIMMLPADKIMQFNCKLNTLMTWLLDNPTSASAFSKSDNSLSRLCSTEMTECNSAIGNSPFVILVFANRAAVAASAHKQLLDAGWSSVCVTIEDRLERRQKLLSDHLSQLIYAGAAAERQHVRLLIGTDASFRGLVVPVCDAAVHLELGVDPDLYWERSVRLRGPEAEMEVEAKGKSERVSERRGLGRCGTVLSLVSPEEDLALQAMSVEWGLRTVDVTEQPHTSLCARIAARTLLV